MDDVADSRNHNDAIMVSSHLLTGRGVASAQHKRKKNTKKKLEETETMMKDWHQNQFEKGMAEVLDEWGRLNVEERSR